jgi:GxxExxY protein
LLRLHNDLPEQTEDVMNRVIGAAIEVHRHLGPGFLEPVYHKAMRIELGERGMKFEAEKRVPVTYKCRRLASHKLDLIVDDCVIVEIKAVSQLEEVHGAQLLSYLKATGLRAGLLMNFNKVVLKAGLRRIVL